MHDQKIERIRSIPVFAHCGDAVLRDIAAIADEVTVEAGRTIVEQGSTLRHAYFVAAGAADVTIDGEQVGAVTPGEVIGEIAMFDPAPASATVTTTVRTEVLVIPHRRLDALVRGDGDLAVSLLRTLARRFHEFQSASAITHPDG